MKVRDIYQLIEAIRAEVPPTYPNYINFMDALDDVKNSANYRAPEVYHLNFNQLGETLYSYLGQPDSDWKQKIADIFNGKIKNGIKVLEVKI